MSIIPVYTPPDFSQPELKAAPAVQTEAAPADGVVPGGFHATSNHPEYVHLGGGEWLLARESRMDAAMVLLGRILEVVEPRLVRKGAPVVLGRSENGEEGIYTSIRPVSGGPARARTSSPSVPAEPGKPLFPVHTMSCTTS